MVQNRLFMALIVAGAASLSACGSSDNDGAALSAQADSVTLTEDSAVSGNVSTNDTGEGLTFSLASGSETTNGTLIFNPDGSYTYTPNADFNGTDSFTYTATDDSGEVATAVVSLTIENDFDSLADFGWELVWSDEFDGDTLDDTNWNIMTGDGSEFGIPGWGNNELEWYQEENLAVADGNLVISAREETVSGYPYTSGRIRSNGKVDTTYGRIEARIKTPAGQGLWSAFWMLPTDSPYGGWASSGEIDIMEAVNPGPSEEILGTIHYGMPWPLNQYTSAAIDLDSSDGFHTYAVEWEADEIRWYLDDVHFNTITSDKWWSYYYGGQETGYINAATGPFDQDFHILLNLAVGGNLPGNVGGSTAFPAEMLVDYVRLYQCPGDGGAGCASWVDDTIVPPAASDVFVASYDLYNDGVQPLSWDLEETVTRELAFTSFWDNAGALVLSEVDAGGDHGLVIDVSTSDSGNFSFYATDSLPIQLNGMGNNPNWWELGAGELKFDLYIDSTNTDAASSLVVKMDSGWPALGQVSLAVADLPQDEWTTVSVKINDLIGFVSPDLLDTSNIVNLFVLEPTSYAHVQLDNIQLICGHPTSCGISPPAAVAEPVDPVDPIDPVDPPVGSATPPVPTLPEADVISIYSDAYTSVTGLDSNPNWGQQTVVTEENIDGNNVLSYAGLNYQGTQFDSQDLSGLTKMHVDYWTADATTLQIFLISTGPAETAFTATVGQGSWISLDIDLSTYAGVVNLADVFQIKVVGDGTILFDNIYFY